MNSQKVILYPGFKCLIIYFIKVNDITPNVCVIEDTNTTEDTNDVDTEVDEVNCSLSIPSLNIIPSTPVRSLSPIHTTGR